MESILLPIKMSDDILKFADHGKWPPGTGDDIMGIPCIYIRNPICTTNASVFHQMAIQPTCIYDKTIRNESNQSKNIILNIPGKSKD